jgi:hypothetical protein
MSDLNMTVSKLSQSKGELIEIELNGMNLKAALVHVGKDDKGKKWTAKVKIATETAYFTRTGDSNALSDEAVKRALLNAFAAVPK